MESQIKAFFLRQGLEIKHGEFHLLKLKVSIGFLQMN